MRGVEAKRQLAERILRFIEADDKPRAYRPIEIADALGVGVDISRSIMETLEADGKLRRDQAKGGALCFRLPFHPVDLKPQSPPATDVNELVRDAVKRVTTFLNSPTIQSLAKRAKKEWIPEVVAEVKNGITQHKVDLGFLDQEGDEVIESIGGATAYAIRILLAAALAAEANTKEA